MLEIWKGAQLHSKTEEKVSRYENEEHEANGNGCCMEEGQKESHCSRKTKKGLERI